MAPTEILAEQHYLKLKAGWLEPLASASLAGRQPQVGSAAAMQAEAASGAQLVVGTHALIQDAVDFAKLGLAIVDEQHRFGVSSASRCARRAAMPHRERSRTS